MNLSQEQANKLLQDVPSTHSFKVHLGAEVTNLKELSEMLDVMNEISFKHHVHEKKNDFATWISHSVGDKELADLVGKQQKQSKIAKLVRKRVRFLGTVQQGNTFMHGITDFLIGTIIGIVLGILLASL